jgi:branched-chain amino acid transport system substrate-binding protein
MDDDTRQALRRNAGQDAKRQPGGVYASTLAYLNAVAATGSDDAKIVVPQMKTFKGKDTRQLREPHNGISGQKCL